MLFGLATLLSGADSQAAGKRSSSVREVPIYTNVSESSPQVIDLGHPTYVEMMDVNWRGAKGRDNVMARIYADGTEVWSGMIPAYDPTFRTSIRRTVQQVEIRIDRGSAYANWAKLYVNDEEGQYEPGNGRGHGHGGSPAFIGNISDADELARRLVHVLRDLQEQTSPEEVRASILPLKKAAARVFAISSASGQLHQTDVYRAVIGLEQEFANQEGFITGLLDMNLTYDSGLSLITIRERYKALFGSVSY
ncbi:MAG TPA: hypothetical protein DCS07_02555 [Bdellovibrionales bacterium]|nr:MAG: hypothetical protein A2Z97_15290 [Bdellovibrionales bacterium GWB1_52_6]OFZ05945.1 MAG: hypothetical protein A2X97_01235 [Bdellovibrionales bacterium GWA1_52_35]OFZ43651.1 MAG: hypothetical protein A2070_11360 [Bdellovibrionales bacterium GWC1_52_8]HAR41505.1 hypothetical protein [Bdellovibrionales bacterium]HCM39437.1 hypothetical protein [Bdellovibrionales bacterium]